MKTPASLLLAGALTALAPTAVRAQATNLQAMIVTNLTGQLRIQQEVPCDDIDQTTPVTAGRLELTPTEGRAVPGGRFFLLARAHVSFAPFSASGSCLGFGETRHYTEVGVQLGRVAPFTATESSPGVFTVVVPKEDLLLYEAAIVDGELETGYRHPREDATGTINLNTGAVELQVAIATSIRFKAGCDPIFDICIIDETGEGTLTATLSGTIAFPDNDLDGVPDRADNCRLSPNADQSPVASPLVRAPADVTLASCLDDQLGTPTAADVCDGGTVTVTSDAPDPLAVGANLVTWTAQDTHGRSGSDTQTVTVVDTTDPTFTFVPPDVSMNNCGPADLGQPVAIDDCAGTPTFTNDAPASFPVGTTVVTWTATDASGNTANATQSVSVVDTVAPTVTCLPAGPPGHTFEVLATDACTAAPVIRLGEFVLHNGERIKVNETGRSGIRLVNVIRAGGIRHFHVGRGEAVITATDESNNVGTTHCH